MIINTNKSQRYYTLLLLINFKLIVKSWTKKFSFPKTCNTEFDEITTIFMDQNGRPLETEDEVNLKSFISK